MPPSTTAVSVGMAISRTRRERTRQFLSARRELAARAPGLACSPGLGTVVPAVEVRGRAGRWAGLGRRLN